jgi:hypothetical protein
VCSPDDGDTFDPIDKLHDIDELGYFLK